MGGAGVFDTVSQRTLSFCADSGVDCAFQWQTAELIKADDAALAEAMKMVAAQKAADALTPKPASK